MIIRGRAFAWLYDRAVGVADERWLGRCRAELLAEATGETLEVGAGTGLNLVHYPMEVRLHLAEPDPAMRRRLERRLASSVRDARVHAAAAANLPFEDDTFDTVVVTLVLCSVPDQRAALRELRRVLRPGGRLLLLEHVRGDGAVARWQDRLDRVWPHLAQGCHPNRDTLSAVEAAGFEAQRTASLDPPGWVGSLAPHVSGVYRPPDLAA